MRQHRSVLSNDEENFIFDVVIEGLNNKRDDLDLDLFALLSHRLMKAGYTSTQLEAIIATAANAVNN
jgi:hypothetical protein